MKKPMTNVEELQYAKERVIFWKKEEKRFTLLVASSADGIFPRLAHMHCTGLYANTFGVVFGKVVPPRGSVRWPSTIVSLVTRKTTKISTGWPLVGFIGDNDREPKWMSEDQELVLCADFHRSDWAKQVLKRLS